MVNGYVDLGTWYGMTPYVGAGLGVAFNSSPARTDTGARSARSTASSGLVRSAAISATSTQANLAWALMAGLDFNVTHNLKLEFGYRYLDYGKFSSPARANCLSRQRRAGSFMPQLRAFKVASKELTSNDFRIGLRYYFDSAPAPRAAARPQILIRRKS